MRSRTDRPAPWLALVSGVALLTMGLGFAQARQHPHPTPGQPCPTPAVPAPPAAPSTTPPSQPQPAPGAGATATSAPNLAILEGEAAPLAPELAGMPDFSTAIGGETVAVAAPTMIGDLLGASQVRCVPIPFSPPPPGTATARGRSFTTNPAQQCYLVPSAANSFKIAENESPRPLDRIYLGFNYYNNTFGDINRTVLTNVGRIDAYRGTFGFEKTFAGGAMSFGMRLPLNELTVQDNGVPGLGGSFSSLGDLSVILKGIAWQSCNGCALLSAGVALTIPTGPDGFADVNLGFVEADHELEVQPFIGFLYQGEDFYIHGFCSAGIPTDSDGTTFLFNDLGIGYWIYRCPTYRQPCRNAFSKRHCGPYCVEVDNAFSGTSCSDYTCGRRFLTGLAPTVEVHVNTPLRHRYDNTLRSQVDSVVFVGGLQMFFLDTATFLLGAGAPITGHSPYDVQVVAQFNLRF